MSKSSRGSKESTPVPVEDDKSKVPSPNEAVVQNDVKKPPQVQQQRSRDDTEPVENVAASNNTNGSDEVEKKNVRRRLSSFWRTYCLKFLLICR